MAEDPGKNNESPEEPRKRKWLVVFLLLVVLSALLFWLLLDRRPGINAWEQTTVPYDSECAEDCKEVGELGEFHGLDGAILRYNPAVDDPIAQWGDCMESILACMDAGADGATSPEAKAALVNNCVAQSTCPKTCINRFARLTSQKQEDVDAAFTDVFVGDRAWCLPVEE